MKNYVEKLERKMQELKAQNVNVDDLTPLYSDFIRCKKVNNCNYIYKIKLLDFLKSQYKKRVKKENFNRKLFSKIIFNNLYDIRQNKNDKIPHYVANNPENEMYKYYASHQYIRRELELLTIDEIILLSYELSKTFKNSKVGA